VSGALALPAGATKEIRALLPTWTACLIVVAAGAVIDSPLISRAALPAYLIGSVALGATSIGAEYTHRTLALLLSQPSPRSRILLIKIGVLAVMVVSLAGLAALTLFEETPGRAGSQELRTLVLLLIVMVSVCLAPAMTMLSRSQLAGTVFTITVPGLVLFSAELIQYAWYGFRSADQEAAARGSRSCAGG
jgi:ABC-type transport system involved in multi-copper enzyme maturation permease subunit